MRLPKIIGLTGGIGSGKTTIANYFKSFGIPVYITDEEAKKITEFPEILNEIRILFGDEIFENQILNRKKLASIVFNDKNKLDKLNRIIHPAVQKDFENWLKNYSNSKFVIKESAILFETGNYKKCDFVITVIVPIEERVKRIIIRDKCTKEDAYKRIENQWTDEQRIEKSTYLIDNLELTEAKKQVDKIIANLSKI